MLRSISKSTNTSEFSPCSSHLSFTALQAFITTKSDLNTSSSGSVGRINIFLTKCDCHAISVTKRIERFEAAEEPQNTSVTYISLFESCS